MELKKMYKGQVFSPTAVITTNISATDTMIPVNDVDAFPDAPNIATIGVDVGAETIIYNDKTSTMLTGCVRGVEGIAKDWEEGVVIGRNFTAKDHGDMVDNIESLETGKLDAEFKVEVTNSGEIEIEGKALDATQNNKKIKGTLANISDYMSTHGYVKESIRHDDKDEAFLNTLIENGKYTVSLTNVVGVVPGWYNIDVTMHWPPTHGSQILKGMGGETTNKMYIRTKEVDWYPAKEIITAKPKVEIINSMLKNGWTIFANDHTHCYKEYEDRIELNMLLTIGDRRNMIIILDSLPYVSKRHVFTGITDNIRVVNFIYDAGGTIQPIMDIPNTSTWVNISATILK